VVGQCQIFAFVMDQRGGVAALQICRLVELLSLADKVAPFLLQDQLPDRIAHILVLHHHRLERN